MEISYQTKLGGREETVSISFDSGSKSDLEMVGKCVSGFHGCIVVESLTDDIDDEQFIEKLRKCHMVIMATDEKT